MTTSTAHTSPVSPDDHLEQDATTHSSITVTSCNRLGRTANPPRSSISSWFRFARRR